MDRPEERAYDPPRSTMTTVNSPSVRPLRVLGDDIRILLASASSPSRIAAMVVDSAPGNGVAPHSHDREEECYFVLQGQLEVTIDGTTETVRAGGFVHVPPGAVHAFRNASAAPTRFLAWAVGGSIDRFFAAVDRDVRELPRDMPALQRLMGEHGIRLAVDPAACTPRR